MIGEWIRRARAAWQRPLTRPLENIERATMHEVWRRLQAEPRHQEPGRLLRFGAKVYSQADEDGILAEVFRRVGTASRRFVEIGVGDGQESNSVWLLLQGWTGTWVEADPRHAAAIRARFAPWIEGGALALVEARVERDNVNELLDGVGDVDLLVLDIDGNDFHVLRALSEVRPRVAVLEYNAKFRPPARWVLPYDPAHRWQESDRFGASLASLEDLARSKGLELVGCGVSGSNAFFVHRDLLGESFCPPFTAENHYEPARYWIVPGLVSGQPPDIGPFVEGPSPPPAR